jgi:hypothetical protein
MRDSVIIATRKRPEANRHRPCGTPDFHTTSVFTADAPMMQGKVQKTNASRGLFTRRPWSILRHSFGFSTAPSCIDSNTCSILRQSFETRNESQGRQSTPPRYPPLSESLSARSQPPWGSPFSTCLNCANSENRAVKSFWSQPTATAALWHRNLSIEKVTYFPRVRLAFFSNRCLNSNRPFKTGVGQWQSVCLRGDWSRSA